VIRFGENEISVTLSMGLAQYRIHREEWQGFLSRADAALYQAKSRGRNRWMIAEE
jgi:diguanylate cyclase (GGDEF)-like protein